MQIQIHIKNIYKILVHYTGYKLVKTNKLIFMLHILEYEYPILSFERIKILRCESEIKYGCRDSTYNLNTTKDLCVSSSFCILKDSVF